MATKTIFATEWTGGGVWGLYQIVQAKYIEQVTGMRMVDLTDMHISHSIGSVAASALLVPDITDPSKPQCRAEDIIDPFITCAAEIFGKDGVFGHRAQSVKHDLHHLMKNAGYKFLSKIFPDLTGKLHKNHDILGQFITDHVGGLKMNKLMKSSCVLAHEMNSISRACFMNLKPDLFDHTLWDNALINNMGDNITVKDAIMASTAAPTMFPAHHIDGHDFIDLSTIYSPTAVIEMAIDMAQQKMKNTCNPAAPILDKPDIQVKLLQITCGDTMDKTGNPDLYNQYGLLRTLGEMHNFMGHDIIKSDHRRLERLIGAENITHLGTSTTPLHEVEQAKLPSNDIFNGNLSNLHKIIAFAEESVAKEHDKIMAYADDVVETRHRESITDPTTAFGIAANQNTHQPLPDFAAGDPVKKTSFFGSFFAFGRNKQATAQNPSHHHRPRLH